MSKFYAEWSEIFIRFFAFSFSSRVLGVELDKLTIPPLMGKLIISPFPLEYT